MQHALVALGAPGQWEAGAVKEARARQAGAIPVNYVGDRFLWPCNQIACPLSTPIASSLGTSIQHEREGETMGTSVSLALSA